jgi:hypothetical protein
VKTALAASLRLSIRVRVVIAVLLAAALAGGAMLTWAVDAQRRAAIAQAKDFAQSVHQLTVAGLTGMMLTGTGQQRAVFLDQIVHANSIRSLNQTRLIIPFKYTTYEVLSFVPNHNSHNRTWIRPAGPLVG